MPIDAGTRQLIRAEIHAFMNQLRNAQDSGDFITLDGYCIQVERGLVHVIDEACTAGLGLLDDHEYLEVYDLFGQAGLVDTPVTVNLDTIATEDQTNLFFDPVEHTIEFLAPGKAIVIFSTTFGGTGEFEAATWLEFEPTTGGFEEVIESRSFTGAGVYVA